MNAKTAAGNAAVTLHLLHDDDDEAARLLKEHHGITSEAFVADDEGFGQAGLHEIRAKHGFSVNTHFDNAPSSGYMVSVAKNTEKVISLASITGKDISDYRTAEAAVLTPGSYCGAWVFENNVYLDVSKLITNRDEAIQAAHDHDQLAIYDLSTGESIDTSRQLVTASRGASMSNSKMAAGPSDFTRLQPGDIVNVSVDGTGFLGQPGSPRTYFGVEVISYDADRSELHVREYGQGRRTPGNSTGRVLYTPNITAIDRVGDHTGAFFDGSPGDYYEDGPRINYDDGWTTDHSPFGDEPDDRGDFESYTQHVTCETCGAEASLRITTGGESPPYCPNGHGKMLGLARGSSKMALTAAEEDAQYDEDSARMAELMERGYSYQQASRELAYEHGSGERRACKHADLNVNSKCPGCRSVAWDVQTQTRLDGSTYQLMHCARCGSQVFVGEHEEVVSKTREETLLDLWLDDSPVRAAATAFRANARSLDWGAIERDEYPVLITTAAHAEVDWINEIDETVDRHQIITAARTEVDRWLLDDVHESVLADASELAKQAHDHLAYWASQFPDPNLAAATFRQSLNTRLSQLRSAR